MDSHQGSASQFAGKSAAGTECDRRGLKPALILNALRGAEASLFHVANTLSWVFSQAVQGSGK
jgi:hypothetical protein